MIHYSCDRCGRPIDPRNELRYVVRIEVDAVMEPIEGDVIEDDDRDHLMELHEILERAEDEADPLIGDEVYRRQQFDLCSECHRKFSENPVGKDHARQLKFSNN
jgi:DNA-directed RNA polymerase subunit RPC12/RpoP